MSLLNTTTTCSGMDWNAMLGLLQRLKQDGKYREHLLIATGCYFGLRANDLLNLKWQDVLNMDEVKIRESKTGKVRSITVNTNLAASFRMVSNELTKKGTLKSEDFLFSNRNGGKLSIQYVNRILHQVFSRYNVKIQNGSTHTLRKTFGKRVWEMDGKSERALIYLSQIFNHSNSQVTRRYIGIVQDDISNIYLGL